LVGVAEWADACAHYQVQLKNFSSDDFRGFSVDHFTDGLPELAADGELGRSWASGDDELGECPQE
jgi:hypothetical protein